MSGIAGIVRFDGAPVEPGLIESMTAAMAHRGPDGIHHWRQGSVALGHCMLRTTPESLEETQPLANEDASLVLVMDGRSTDRTREVAAAEGARVELDPGKGKGSAIRASLSLAKGDIVWVAEIGGDFMTRAEVRSISIGKDNIPRLSLKFLDQKVPDRLIAT